MLPLSVFAVLGGATRQAVHKSGDPVTWLKARVRRAIMPKIARHRKANLYAVHKQMQDNCAVLIQECEERLTAALAKPKRGRGMVNEPQELAQKLGIDRDAETYAEVFAFLLKKLTRIFYQQIAQAAKSKSPHWYKVRAFLDTLWPRWVRRTSAQPPPLQKQTALPARA